MGIIDKIKTIYWQNKQLSKDMQLAIDEINYLKRFITREPSVLHINNSIDLNNVNYVAHALGELDGITYTNSKEAFEHSYSLGIRVFETDVCLTLDKVPVMCHEWGPYNNGNLVEWKEYLKNFSSYSSTPPLYRDFINTKILGKYTPLSLYDLICIAKDYKDSFFIVSVKSQNWEYDNDAQLSMIALYEMIKNDESCLERFIPQVHSVEYAKYLLSNCKFKQVAFGFRPDKIQIQDLNYLIDEIGIQIFIMNKNQAGSDYANCIRNRGKKIIYHTVNTNEDFQLLSQYGQVCVITDYLY